VSFGEFYDVVGGEEFGYPQLCKNGGARLQTGIERYCMGRKMEQEP